MKKNVRKDRKSKDVNENLTKVANQNLREHTKDSTKDSLRQQDNDKQQTRKRITIRMQKKMVILYCCLLLLFALLSVKLMWINNTNGDQYKKKIFEQQKYDSITLPFRRGDIVDKNQISLAVSEKVYNLVIDAKVMQSGKGDYLEPTLLALSKSFPQLDMTEIRDYVKNHAGSSYYVPLKKMSYEEIKEFKTMQSEGLMGTDGKKISGTLIKGVWFEEEYKRTYPNGTLACDVIGFTTTDGKGMYGLEENYNDILNGETGREFGYLNGDSSLERTTKPAVDGNTLVSTIDVNIQSVVEKYLKEFDSEYVNNYTTGPSCNNIGCIIMEVNTGNVLAMASYPVFDLNTPYDLSTFYTEEEINGLKENNTFYDVLNKLWRNYCISDTYEPGSTFKPFTVATGLETGKLLGNETYECGGKLEVNGETIKCHNKYGDGTVSLKKAIACSCNVALMKMAFDIGIDTFADYQRNFGFGLKTNIDLPGEARTAELVYTKEKMGTTELATSSFGQGFTVTMIQMITGFSSLVNGGYYYEPHLVKQIRTTGGSVVSNIEPRVLKQTISESTSAMIRDYCEAVCDPDYSGNTGKTARPAGYSIGGKTGTAQTLPRGNGEYVVSFMGYAPADNPEIAIYVVVDRPNMKDQSQGTKCATKIVRGILTEVLPYLGIFMTEDLSDSEKVELEAKKLEDTRKYASSVSSNDAGVIPGREDLTPEDTSNPPIWKTFAKDPETGYLIDPNTRQLLDPETGDPIEGNNDPLTQ